MSADYKAILRALDAEGVRYVLVGGLAAIALGGAHVTDDMDICYDRSDDNLHRLARVLLGFRARLRGAPAGLPFRPDAATLKAGLNFTFSTSVGDVDALGELEKVGGYEALHLRAEPMELYGVKVQVISLEDLIKAKKAAGRPKDKLHLLELEELRKLRKRS